jgi:hypothetical protein
MTPDERFKEIENRFKNMNNFGWPEDVTWLTARVKKLTKFIKASCECHRRAQLCSGCKILEEL